MCLRPATEAAGGMRGAGLPMGSGQSKPQVLHAGLEPAHLLYVKQVFYSIKLMEQVKLLLFTIMIT